MPASPRYIQSVLGSPETVNTVARVLEPAVTMATATAAEPVAGIAALLTGDADTVGRVQDRLTYNPRSKAGQEGLKALSDAFVEMAEAIGIDDAVAYFEDTVVPSLQSRFGTEVGSAMGAGILAGASIMAPGRTTKTLRGVEFDEGFDPRVKEQERLQNLELQIEERPMAEKPVISLEDLEGRPFVTSMSDRTSAGGRLVAVNDVDLGEGVDLKGGQDFMFDNPDMVWASDPQVVAGLKKRADILRQQTGKDPIYLPWQMAPTGGDHATMTTEVMLRHAKSNMMKKDQKALDKEIKQIIPDWKGVNDPASMDQIYNVSGDKRKQIQQLMDVGYRDKGGMSRGEARLAVSDMTQLQGRQGRLINVGEIGEGDIIVDSGHPTYPAALRGQGLGALDRDIVATEILPSMVETRRIADPANPSAQDIRALQMKGYYGIIDEDLLRALER